MARATYFAVLSTTFFALALRTEPLFASCSSRLLGTRFSDELQKAALDADKVSVMDRNVDAGYFTYITLRGFFDSNSLKLSKSKPILRKGMPLRENRLQVTKREQAPAILWAPVMADRRGWGPRIRFIQVANIYSRAIDNVPLLMENLALSFISGPLDTRVGYKVHLRTVESDALAKQLGRDVWFETEVRDTFVREIDWIALRFSEFKLVDETGAALTHSPIQANDSMTAFGVSAYAKKPKAPKTVTFSRGSAIDLEMHLPESLDLDANLRLMGVGLNGFSGGDASEQHGSGYGANPQSAKTTLLKFFRSMMKPANQQYAAKIVRQGTDAIEHELQEGAGPGQLRFSITPYYDSARKKTVEPVLNGKTSLFEVMSHFSNLRIPFEDGPFGDLHGKFSHHAQFIAGMRDLTPNEKTIIAYFMAYELGVPIPRIWPTWQLLFDSRSNSVFGNRFWRDLIEAP